ncbi:MAG: holo-ACP synthase [Angelakisella sp.]
MQQIMAGVDSVEIARMERLISRESFCNRIFSVEEQQYIVGKHHPAQTAAGHFAAKEAFLKAMGTGITRLDLCEVGVSHDVAGAPRLALRGWASELAEGWSLSLSITHTNATATAFVVAYHE